MSVINMAKNIKKIHPKSLICYKVGNFYNLYGKDAYILSYLLDYKLKDVEDNIAIVGFPKNALSKIMALLERKKINYIIIDTKNNYNVDAEQNYKNLNKYEEIFEKAHKSVSLKIRVEKIAKTLLKCNDIDKIRKIEKFIYETRKI